MLIIKQLYLNKEIKKNYDSIYLIQSLFSLLKKNKKFLAKRSSKVKSRYLTTILIEQNFFKFLGFNTKIFVI